MKLKVIVFLVLIIVPIILESQSQHDPLLERANNLYNRGKEYVANNQFENAIDYLEKAALLFEQIGDYPDYANSLNDIGGCYYHHGDYTTAIRYHQQALAVFEKVYGKEHHDYASCLSDIAYCYFDLGDYASALECDKQALSIWEMVYGKKHPNYAISLSNIGVSYANQGDYNKSLQYHLQASVIFEDLYGKDHPDYALSLNKVGAVYLNLGDYPKALEYFLKSMAIFEKIYDKEYSQYAEILNNIGVCYYRLGDYPKSLECYQLALSTIEKVYGKKHPYYATGLMNIASYYFVLGDFIKSLEYDQQALTIIEKAYGKNSKDYAGILLNIGHDYRYFGDFAQALESYNQALDIWESFFGKEHQNYALNLLSIGECYQHLGYSSRAREYAFRSLAILEKTCGKEHPSYAAALSAISIICFYQQEYLNALEYSQLSLAVLEKVVGKEHPDYAEILKTIGICFFYLGEYGKSQDIFSLYSDITTSFVTKSFSSLTESHRLWNRYKVFFTDSLFAISTKISSPDMNSTAYNGALFGKGLMLNLETEMSKLILESGDNEALDIYNSIKESRKRLDLLYQNPLGKKSKIDSLNKDIDSREAELMKRSMAFGDYTRNLTLKWTDVKAALGKKDIAIEFATYTHQDTTSYIALTLKAGYTEPHLVSLFNSEDLAEFKASQYYSSTSFSNLIWDNLSEELEGVSNVYFSPAGELNNIGIEYLLDEDGKHLVSEKRNYFRLTSTRELVKEYNPKRIANATVYGGIRYDISPDSRLTAEETESERLTMSASRSYIPLDSLSGTRGGWKYLPGSKAEAEAISSTLRSKRIHNDLLEGTHGTEESFKRLSGAKKDVIHIATHGFYWTDTDVARRRMEIYSFMLDKENQAPYEDKALTRSGLLFAGAQNTFEGKEVPLDVEDGILTAKEISRLDLRGTDLVVISACQSGLGEVTGDGVFGLQRGFKKAGVQSLVMSLWEVDDEATRIMMTRFYENLTRGKSKYNSFDEAQSYLRKYERGKFDKPQYYAAFVLLDAIN